MDDHSDSAGFLIAVLADSAEAVTDRINGPQLRERARRRRQKRAIALSLLAAAASAIAIIILTSVGAASRSAPTIPPPPLPAVTIRANGRILPATSTSKVTAGHPVSLAVTVSVPAGTTVTALAVELDASGWLQPAAGTLAPATTVARFRHLHVTRTRTFTARWTPARTGRTFLGILFVTDTRTPFTTGGLTRRIWPFQVTP
jgi:hypothetical protein